MQRVRNALGLFPRLALVKAAGTHGNGSICASRGAAVSKSTARPGRSPSNRGYRAAICTANSGAPNRPVGKVGNWHTIFYIRDLQSVQVEKPPPAQHWQTAIRNAL